MEKIKTIFHRDENNGGVITNVYEIPIEMLKESIATEKIDGTNVRVTVRNQKPVRLEKRRNPDKIHKYQGIIEPWYVDADENDNADKWIYDALKNTILVNIPDGEWSGEAVGTNIQGNPLNLDCNKIVFFTLGQCPELKDVPLGFEELKDWLPKQESKVGTGCKIEGIVWWRYGIPIGKIKTKDFRETRHEFKV